MPSQNQFLSPFMAVSIYPRRSPRNHRSPHPSRPPSFPRHTDPLPRILANSFAAADTPTPSQRSPPPHPASTAEHASERETHPPSSQARRWSDLSTVPPRSIRPRVWPPRPSTGSGQRLSSNTTEPPPELSQVGVQGDYGTSPGPTGGPQTTLNAPTASDEDRITVAVEAETVNVQTQVVAPLCRREILLLAYNFIGEHTDAVLRKVLKVWQRKVSGSKTERITRAYLYFRVSLIGGEAAGELFRKCVKDAVCLFKDFDAWMEDNRSSVEHLAEVPSDADLMRTFRPVEVAHWKEFEAVAEQRRQMVADGDLPEVNAESSGYGGSASGVGGSPFSLSQFARLCLLLRDDPVANLAFQGTGQELSMVQQRNRVNRDDYWRTVAERFNNADFHPRIDTRPELPLETLDPSSTPLSPVGALKLKTVWTDMRGPFTKAHNDFKKSGQNDPTLLGTLRFLQTNGNGQLCALSKRVLVMFIVLRIGRDNRGTDDQGSTAKAMLSMALRVIPGGDGFDEAGSGISSGVGGNGAIITGSSSDEGDDGGSASGSRKKRKTVAVSEDTSFLCQHIKGLTDSLSSRQADTGEGSLAAFVESGKLMEVLQEAQEQLRTAETRAKDDDDVLLKLTTARFEKIRADYERKFGETA